METIIDKDLLIDFKDCMIIYGAAVTFDRAFPDKRDGLKPVQRRALYSMYDLGATGNNTKKTARITGDTIGRFQPHGDTSVAGAIATMANWWSENYPLVAHNCNFGSMQGDGPANQRYTECRVSDFAYDIFFKELRENRDVTDWVETYDREGIEPMYLPSKIPLLLVNGSFGIGVGYKNEVPPHPLGDVIDQTIKLIRNPNHQVVLIPDQCMKCEIIGTQKDWVEISTTGNGSFYVQGKIDIDEIDGYPTLRIRSTPDMRSLDKGGDKGGIVESIADMVEKKLLTMIIGCSEHSHGNDMDYRIKLRKGSDPNYVKEMIYKNTDMRRKITVNCIFIEDTKIEMFNYTSYIQAFINLRRIAKYRKYVSMHTKKMTEIHKIEPFINLLAREDYEQIVSDIRTCKGGISEIINLLIIKYKIDDIQAKTLCTEGGLASLNVNVLQQKKADYDKKMIELQQLRDIIVDPVARDKEIIDELMEIKRKYARPRNSEIIGTGMVGEVPGGDFNVVITEQGYIKKFTLNDTNIKPGKDTPKHVVKCDNRDSLLLFSAQGILYKIPVEKIPLVSGATNPGAKLQTFCRNLVSTIRFAVPHSVLADMHEAGNDLVILTRENCIKRLPIPDILNVNTSGMFYTRFTKQGDFVVGVDIVNDNNDIIVYSDKKALRMSATEVPIVSRVAVGNKAMGTDTGIDGMTVIHSLNEPKLVIITSPLTGGRNCKVNKIITAALGKSGRTKAGSSVIRLGKDEIIKSIHACSDEDKISIITSTAFMTLDVKDIPDMSSVSSGVTLNTNKGDIILTSWVLR